MASDAGFGRAEGTESSLKKIKRFLLQVPLLKRSETIPTTSTAQLVQRAYREGLSNFNWNDSTYLRTVATLVAAANSTVMEASEETEAAMMISMRAALGLVTNNPNEGHLDDLTIMKIAKQHKAGL